MNKKYKEPSISFLVLDFCKEKETRYCLESIKTCVDTDYKVIYYHNGNEVDYSYQLFKDGLIDHFIQTRKNEGLGVGTRDLFAASFSEYSIYLQNDQYLARKLSCNELNDLMSILEGHEKIPSIGLAGPVCGQNIFSERCFITKTEFYKKMERELPLSCCGAGPYHDGIWREGQIQEYYKNNGYLHFAWKNPLVIDNGRTAERQNPDGSRWRHFPDTKNLWLVKGPVKEKYIYPFFDENEWKSVLETQQWTPGKIPNNELKNSFHVWH